MRWRSHFSKWSWIDSYVHVGSFCGGDERRRSKLSLQKKTVTVPIRQHFGSEVDRVEWLLWQIQIQCLPKFVLLTVALLHFFFLLLFSVYWWLTKPAWRCISSGLESLPRPSWALSVSLRTWTCPENWVRTFNAACRSQMKSKAGACPCQTNVLGHSGKGWRSEYSRDFPAVFSHGYVFSQIPSTLKDLKR